MMQTLRLIDKFLQKNKTKGGNIVFLVASFIATGCFVGKLKYAPGTFGSLLAIIFCPYFTSISCMLQIFILVFLFATAFISTHIYLIKINDFNKDPKEVVIDEIVAVLLLTWLCQLVVPANLMNWGHFLSIFILFRFFDVVKPYPISFVDKNVHGAKGIILDDVMACIASWLVFAVAY